MVCPCLSTRVFEGRVATGRRPDGAVEGTHGGHEAGRERDEKRRDLKSPGKSWWCVFVRVRVRVHGGKVGEKREGEEKESGKTASTRALSGL